MDERERKKAADEFNSFYNKKYDLKNEDDLKEAFLLAIGVYRDYWHHSDTLNCLLEDFDESVERYDTATWFNISLSSDKADRLAAEGYESLNATCSVFDRLAARAKTQCTLVMKVVLSAPKTTCEAILGKAYQFSEDTVDERIEELYEGLSNYGYDHNIRETLKDFREVMSDIWGATE